MSGTFRRDFAAKAYLWIDVRARWIALGRAVALVASARSDDDDAGGSKPGTGGAGGSGGTGPL